MARIVDLPMWSNSMPLSMLPVRRKTKVTTKAMALIATIDTTATATATSNKWSQYRLLHCGKQMALLSYLREVPMDFGDCGILCRIQALSKNSNTTWEGPCIPWW